jgi:hypothetical protein
MKNEFKPNSNQMKHPEKWYIPVTKENYEELNQWRLSERTEEASRYDDKFVPGATLLSAHPHDDGSYFYAKGHSITRRDNDYQEITLEQFREITNTMKHPKKWYIPVTNENHEELNPWWLEQVRKSGWGTSILSILPKDIPLLSEHPTDSSYYWGGSEESFTEMYRSYKKITLEQFREITNSNQTQTPMSKSIQISRDLLNAYYEAATTPQKEYLTEHFKLDGTTTVEAIRGLHDMACKGWKPKIKKNHPDCFPITKYFDFSEHASSIISQDVCRSLGLENDFIQVRNSSNPETDKRSFYLSHRYNWELMQEGPSMVLIPTKKSC